MSLHTALIDYQAHLHLACAGAGLDFMHQQWRTPGSSRYLAGTTLLQAREATDRFIGFGPGDNRYCHPKVTEEIAIAAYLEAARTLPYTSPHQPIGMAINGAVATTRLPRGDQRAHLACFSARGLHTDTIYLEKRVGKQARADQDRLIAQAATSLLQRALQHDGQPVDVGNFLQRATFTPWGTREPTRMSPALLFPANFNPPHNGHWQICQAAERSASGSAELTLELCPPNKERIPLAEALRRLALVQTDPEGRTRALTFTQGQSTYLEKARTRPGSAFILGADAFARLFDPQWGHDLAAMTSEFLDLETHFYVAGRQLGQSRLSADQFPIPAPLQERCHALPIFPAQSSTQLRQKARVDFHLP